MPYDDDPAAFARAARSMADTLAILAQTTQQIAGTQRLALRLQGLTIGLLGLSLLGLGWLMWQIVMQSQDHVAQTRALITLLHQIPH